MACCFFLSALLAWDCFWEDFFWFAFGDLSPMVLWFSSGLSHLRLIHSSDGDATLRASAETVNDRAKSFAVVWRECAGATFRPLFITAPIVIDPMVSHQ